MRIPVPNNKLVAFTVVGALLTVIVAGALAAPIGVLTQPGGQADQSDPTASATTQQVGLDAPTPNQGFTPAVQQQSGYEEEHGEYEEEHDEEGVDDHEEGEDGEEEDEEREEEEEE